MAHASLNHVLHLLRRIAKAPEAASATDAYLLGRFTTQREEDAFATLVRRHGPMVLGVCRRVLKDEHLSEDAFQATFLVLARKAGSIRKPAVLGGWLYRVAYHIALRARQQADRRRALERPGGDLLPEQPTREPFQPDLRRMLDDEVSRLPEKYRTPLILCYWEGKTYEEAAAQLGCPGGTVSGRLARARQLLRSRLVRRGLALSTGALATELSADVTCAAVSASQVNAIVKAAMLLLTRRALAPGVVSAYAITLATETLRTMFLTKLKLLTGMLVAFCLIGTVAGVILTSAGNAEPAATAGNAWQEETPAPFAISSNPSISAREPVRIHQFQVSSPARVAFSVDGKTLTAAEMQTIHRWDVNNSQELPKWERKGWSVIGLSPNGQTAAMQEAGKGVHLLDTATGEELRQLDGKPDLAGGVNLFTFSPDVRLIADVSRSSGLAGNNWRIRFWDVTTGKELEPLLGLSSDVRSMAISGDNLLLAVGYLGTDIELHDLATRKRRHRFGEKREPHPDDAPETRSRSRIIAISSLAFSPDGKMLAAGNNDGGIDLYDVATTTRQQHLGEASRSLKDLNVPGVGALAFSRDGKTLLSVDTALSRGTQRRAHLWDLPTGKEYPGLQIQGQVSYGALSADGRKLAGTVVAGRDVTVEVWDVAGRP